MILKAQITLSTEEYTVLQQVAKEEGITIQELLAKRFQDLVDKEIEKAVDKEIEKALEQMSKERQQ